MSETPQTTSIPMDDRTKRFYQGVAAGSKVAQEHASVDFPDDATRLALFYFYAGVLAAHEHECRTQEDFEPFLLGVRTRTPHATTEDDEQP